MIFKLKNKTDWHSKDLKSIAKMAMIRAGAMPNCQSFTVIVKNTRSKFVHGYAWLGTHKNPQNWILCIPKPIKVTDRKKLLTIVCQVAHHEALHAVGANHKHMTKEQRKCKQDVSAWADKLILRSKEEAKQNS